MQHTAAPVAPLNPRRCLVTCWRKGESAWWPLAAKVRRQQRIPRRGRQRHADASEGSTPAPDRDPVAGATDNLADASEIDEEAASSDEPVDEAQVSEADLESLTSELLVDLDDHLDENFMAMQEGFVVDDAADRRADAGVPDDFGLAEEDVAPPLDEVLAPEAAVLDQPGPAEAAQEPQEEGPGPAEEEGEAADEPALAAEGVVAQPLRQRAEVKLEVDGGLITFYATKNIFVATCRNELHGKCSLTRSALPGRRKGQGRPLGLLKAWLCIGQDLDSKEAHWSAETWPNFEARSYHRELLEALPGSFELLESERPQEPGEGAEPDLVA